MVLVLTALLISGFLCLYPFWTEAWATVQGGTKVQAEVEKLQEGILDWKSREGGAKGILSGSLLERAGSPTEDWYAFTISRMGRDEGQALYLARLMQFVEKTYQDLKKVQRDLKPSDWYRIALTVEACGGSSTDFGTDAQGQPIDLINDGVWNCIFGDPGFQGINGYIWALLLVDSRSYEQPADAKWTREELVVSILEQQQEDGGFALMRGESDPDLTAMVLTALAPYRESGTVYTYENMHTKERVSRTVGEVIREGFSCLSAMQREDGTFASYGERSVESTDWVLLSLCANGIDPASEEDFSKNGSSLLSAISLFRLPDGSFIHSLDAEEPETEGNEIASYQTLYALEGYRRILTGKPALFDLTDAPEISKKEIEKAAADLGELADEQNEKDVDTVRTDIASRSYILSILLVVTVAGVVLYLAVLHGKKKKQVRQISRGEGEKTDDEADW